MINKFIFIIFSIILTLLFSYNQKKKNVILSQVFFVLLILFLSLIFTFRDIIFPNDVGTDYYEYKNWFELISFNNLKFNFQNIGFNTLISIVKIFTNNYYIFLFICGFLINYLIIKFILENTEDMLFSSIIYYCLMFFLTFNVLRQWIACAIFVFAFKYIKKHDFVKYTLAILIGASFHDTAIILLLLYPILLSKKMNFYREEILSILITFFSFLNINFVIRLMDKICNILGINYFHKYTLEYLESQSGNFTFLIISIILLILINFKLFNSQKKANNYMVFIRYFLCLFPFAALSIKNGIFTRYLIYFEFAIIPAIDIIFSLFEAKSKMLLKISIIFILILNFIL